MLFQNETIDISKPKWKTKLAVQNGVMADTV